MKKFILSLLALISFATGMNAQTWKMVVTHEDGSQDTLSTSAIKNVFFAVADQNVDQVIIKELYNGGCPRNIGSSYFQWDKGVILYNNCPEVAVVNNLCIGMAAPFNAHAQNDPWISDGKLIYSDYIPAPTAIWYFQQPVIIQPYSQIVVSMFNSIDNTKTYQYSVNYADSSYYAMYDPESGLSATTMYPTPADVIPTSHYLKAGMYGQGTAWTLSVTDPAFFIFQVKGTTPAEYAANADNYVFAPGAKQNASNRCLKVPTSWIIDGVEVYQASTIKDSNKRLTSDIDNGYVVLTNKLGHSEYRNVDAEATEALSENAGKLVYNYSQAVDDANNGEKVIDAEASIKNGAHIIYQDTNNSTNDFHERKQFSLRGE